MPKIINGIVIVSGKARGGGGGTARPSAGGAGGTVITSGSYVAAIDAASGGHGIHVNLDVDDASILWQLVTSDRRHERVQSSLRVPGATSGNYIDLTLPVGTASGAAGNAWRFGVTPRQIGRTAVTQQEAYVDLFADTNNYVRIQFKSTYAAGDGADGNGWQLRYVQTSGGGASNAVNINTTNRTITVQVISSGSITTLAQIVTTLNADSGVSAAVTATVVGTGSTAIGARTVTQVRGSQSQGSSGASYIQFHSGVDGVTAQTEESIAVTVNSTAMTITLRAADGVDTLADIATALNTSIVGLADVEPDASGSFLDSRYFSSPPTSLTNFSGGFDIEPLSVTIDVPTQEVRIQYEASFDTLTGIVNAINAVDGVSARLYAGVNGLDYPTNPPQRTNFSVEVILSEQDVLHLILAQARHGNTDPFDASKIPFGDMPLGTLLSILGWTQDNLNDAFMNVSRTGNRIRFTQRDASTIDINLPIIRILTAAQVSVSNNVYTLSPSPSIATLSSLEPLRILVPEDNTGAVTARVSGGTALPLYRSDNTPIVAGDLKKGAPLTLTYFEADTALSLPARFVTDVGVAGRYTFTKVGAVSGIPASPVVSDIIRFTAAISTGLPSTLKGRDGTTTETAVGIGDEYRWDGTNWLKIGDGGGTGSSGSITDTDTHYTFTKVDAVADIPSSPAIGDVVRITTTISSNVPTTFRDRLDSLSEVLLIAGDEYRYDGTNWLRLGQDEENTHYTFWKIDAVGAIPNSAGVGDIIRFTAAISASIPTTFKGRDGTTVETSVGIGDEYRWDGTDWLKIGDGVGAGGSITDTDTHYTYTEVGAVASIPSSPATGDVIRFTAVIAASIPTTVKGRDGSTTETAVGIGDEYRWNGTNWLKIGDGDTDTDTDTHYTLTDVGAVGDVPSSPATGDVIRITASIASGVPTTFKGRDGTTTETALGVGDEYRWDGTNWLKIAPSNLSELAGMVSDSQIPSEITRDTELDALSTLLGDRITSLENADEFGGQIAETAALETAGDSDLIAATWTEHEDAGDGVSIANNGVVLPATREAGRIGIIAEARTGDTIHSSIVIPYGALDPDIDNNDFQGYSPRILQWGNSEYIFVVYYLDETLGPIIQLYGANKTLPANSTVRLYWQLGGGGSEGGSSGQQQGVTVITPRRWQLTQWIRSSTTPTTPGSAQLNDDGTFNGFPESGWSDSIPTGDAPLWVATATMNRNAEGQWSLVESSSWSVVSEDSARVEFYNYDTESWESTPPATMSQFRIWVNGAWQTLPIGTSYLLWTTDVNDYESTTLSDIPLSDIDRIRFDIDHGTWSYSTSISVAAVAGTALDLLPVYEAATEGDRHARTLVIVIDDYGHSSVAVLGANSIRQLNYTVGGGFYLNFFANSDNELTNARIISTYGRVNYFRTTVTTNVRIYLETN